MINQEEMEPECRHLWMIDRPNGPTSQGVCKLCGEHGEFKNSMPVSGWDRVRSQRRRAKQAKG